MAHRILLMLYMDAGSPQHLYQDMQKYVVIFLMNIFRSIPSDNFLTNRISIVFWRNVCYMFVEG